MKGEGKKVAFLFPTDPETEKEGMRKLDLDTEKLVLYSE